MIGDVLAIHSIGDDKFGTRFVLSSWCALHSTRHADVFYVWLSRRSAAFKGGILSVIGPVETKFGNHLILVTRRTGIRIHLFLPVACSEAKCSPSTRFARRWAGRRDLRQRMDTRYVITPRPRCLQLFLKLPRTSCVQEMRKKSRAGAVDGSCNDGASTALMHHTPDMFFPLFLFLLVRYRTGVTKLHGHHFRGLFLLLR